MNTMKEQRVLIVTQHDAKDLENGTEITNVTSISVEDFIQKGAKQSHFDVVIFKPNYATLFKYDKLLPNVFTTLKPGGSLNIEGNISDESKLELDLIINGFIEVNKCDTHTNCKKPSYEIGSSSKLKLSVKPVKSVWKLDDSSDQEDMIDPDNLLDDEDLKKPDPLTLRVCGTTGKRKACKDCSCGLADELAGETEVKNVNENAPKSSCGSCYLGDAFRCATCPYLGMPAFKPGEKVQLNENLLKIDV